jgi:hypothetical protein
MAWANYGDGTKLLKPESFATAAVKIKFHWPDKLIRTLPDPKNLK